MTRVAILGCGMISGAYAPTIAEFPHLDLVACADIDRSRATALAEAQAIPEACSVDELLERDDIDIAVNLTPAALHVPVTRAALEAGMSVYSEKPLGTDLVDARELVELADERGVRLGCAPDTFLGTGLQTAAAAIDAGSIGTPLAATAFMLSAGPDRWHPNPDIFFVPGAGPLYDMGPYYLTAMIQLLGPARRVTAMASNPHPKRMVQSGPRRGEMIDVGTPTHVATTIELEAGPIATLVTSFDVAASRYRCIEVYGTEGTLSVPDPNLFEGAVGVRRLGDREWAELEPRRTPLPQQRGVGVAEMAWATSAGRPHRASGELALHVVDIMASALVAADEGRSVAMSTTCDRPRMLPVTLSPNTFDN